MYCVSHASRMITMQFKSLLFPGKMHARMADCLHSFGSGPPIIPLPQSCRKIHECGWNLSADPSSFQLSNVLALFLAAELQYFENSFSPQCETARSYDVGAATRPFGLSLLGTPVRNSTPFLTHAKLKTFNQTHIVHILGGPLGLCYRF